MKMRMTVKKYYLEPDWMECMAEVVKIHEGALELNETIAFPEGGGQEGDCGVISLLDKPDVAVEFDDTQLSLANPFLGEETDCKTGGIVLHKTQVDLSSFQVGDRVLVKIDAKRRDALTKSHSATHMMYCGVKAVRPEILSNIIGCHIKCDGGRLDFATENRFSAEEIAQIERVANEWIAADYDVNMTAHEAAYDVRYWSCNGVSMPCGGTHVRKTGMISPIKVSRKNIGKNKERVYFVYA